MARILPLPRFSHIAKFTVQAFVFVTLFSFIFWIVQISKVRMFLPRICFSCLSGSQADSSLEYSPVLDNLRSFRASEGQNLPTRNKTKREKMNIKTIELLQGGYRPFSGTFRLDNGKDSNEAKGANTGLSEYYKSASYPANLNQHLGEDDILYRPEALVENAGKSIESDRLKIFTEEEGQNVRSDNRINADTNKLSNSGNDDETVERKAVGRDDFKKEEEIEYAIFGVVDTDEVIERGHETEVVEMKIDRSQDEVVNTLEILEAVEENDPETEKGRSKEEEDYKETVDKDDNKLQEVKPSIKDGETNDDDDDAKDSEPENKEEVPDDLPPPEEVEGEKEEEEEEEKEFSEEFELSVKALDTLISSLETDGKKDPQANILRNQQNDREVPATLHRNGKEYKLRSKVTESVNNIYKVDLDESLLSDPAYQPRETKVSNFIEEYKIIPSEKLCGRHESSSPYLLALQLSMSRSLESRMITRLTWGSVAYGKTWPGDRAINARVKVVFILARSPKDENEDLNEEDPILHKLEEEAAMFDDILYVDMIDTYSNLTLKVLSGLNWVNENCKNVKYVLKVDEDTFVNVPLMIDVLLYMEKELQGQVLGWGYGKSNVQRWGRWYVSWESFAPDRFPSYLSGCAYVLSVGAVNKIVDIAPYFPMVPIEDAFITGVLRVAIKIPMHVTYQFTFLYDGWPDCDMYFDYKMAGTGVYMWRCAVLWQSYQNDGENCYRQEVTRRKQLLQQLLETRKDIAASLKD